MNGIPKWLNIALPIVPHISKIQHWINSINKHETIRKNLQTSVYFATPHASKTKRVYLYLHGYGSSVYETYPLTHTVAQTHNANIISQRIARHGIDLAPLEYLSPEEWFYSALQGLAIAQKLGDEVFVIGCSTGATLALLLSARSTAAQEMLQQILISPNCYPAEKALASLFLYPGSRYILENITRISSLGSSGNQVPKSKHRIIDAETKMQEEHCTLRSPTQAIAPMMQLVKCLWNILKKDPHSYSIPTTVISNPLDKEVSYPMIKKILRCLSRPSHHRRV